MASIVSETVPKFTAEALKSAAKQSERCHIVPIRLRRAIKKYLRGKLKALFHIIYSFILTLIFVGTCPFRVLA